MICWRSSDNTIIKPTYSLKSTTRARQAWTCFTVARGTAKYDDKRVKDDFWRHDVKLDFFTANLLLHDTMKEFYQNIISDDDILTLNILPLEKFLEEKQNEIDKNRTSYPKEVMKIRNARAQFWNTIGKAGMLLLVGGIIGYSLGSSQNSSN